MAGKEPRELSGSQAEKIEAALATGSVLPEDEEGYAIDWAKGGKYRRLTAEEKAMHAGETVQAPPSPGEAPAPETAP